MTDTEMLTEHENQLPLLPLKNMVILPKSIIPIVVGRKKSIKAVEYALKHDRTLFITSQKDTKADEAEAENLYHFGTRATILQVMRNPDGAFKILAEGICRARATHIDTEGDFFTVSYEDVPTSGIEGNDIELWAGWRQLHQLYLNYTKLNEKAPADLIEAIKTPTDMDYMTDTIAVHIFNPAYPMMSLEDRQKILELHNLEDRMLYVSGVLQREVDILQAQQRIQGRVQTQVEKNQREYYLNEQMKAIQKELGREDQSADIDEIRAKIKKLGLSTDAYEKVEKELNRLEQMPPLSSEAAISRNYIDWIMSLPWKKETKDTIGIKKAEHILENTHAGLKKAKERIIEFLAAKKFSKNLERSPILCLVGPPGVGKTSLAKSVAESLGREFVRISLGGVRDEAEIRGHRRTYIGALPGKIIQSMKKANSINPVILLDEIDKMSHDVHGDPAAALLEVLDPEQNKNFVDHFLDTEYDLSRVMFIATANVADHIPYALYDRLEMIPLSGYTIEEKNAIAKKFLVPRNLLEHSLDKMQFRIPDDSINTIINHYTKESGVRQLERIITKLMRKSIQQLLKDKNKKSITVTNQLILEWLGNHVFKPTSLSDRADRIGLATGLAWTEVGGDVLEIETTALAGKGTVTLTGQLGDVMQESAQAAISYIRSRAEDLNIKPSFYANRDIHVHLPEGATPKDGPSAGITMCCAIISALTKNALRPDIAMTGEITLQGRVLAIGGLKEKLLAARQHGFKTVIIPDENKDDLIEIRKEIAIDDLNIVPVKSMDQVLETAFVKSPFAAKKNILRKKKTSSKKIKPARKLARLTA